jgi:hypothetical protein
MGGIMTTANGASVDKTSAEFLNAVGVEDASDAVVDAATENPEVAAETEGLDVETGTDDAAGAVDPTETETGSDSVEVSEAGESGMDKKALAVGALALAGVAVAARRGN